MGERIGGQRAWVKAVAFGSTIGTTLAILVGGGYFLGNYLDRRWDTFPLLTLTLMIGGVIFGGSSLVITLKKLSQTDQNHEDK